MAVSNVEKVPSKIKGKNSRHPTC